MIARIRFWKTKAWAALKRVFQPARTALNRVVRGAWFVTLAYIVFLAGALWKKWPTASPPLQGLLDAVFAVALMILSIRYSGVFTDFYQKLTAFGITDIRVNRHGQDPNFTQLWIDRISGSKDIVIVGTSSRGWFRQAGVQLGLLLSEQPLVTMNVYLLDPFGTIWRGLVGSNTVTHSGFIDDEVEVFRTLHELAIAYPNQFLVHLYDTEPMSFVRAKGAIYLGLYLPRTSRKEVPEFTISEGSFLGQKVIESAAKLMNTAPLASPDAIANYRQIMQRHALNTREQFWSDPLVYCDFCKELAELPCTFSRRHVDLANKRVFHLSSHCSLLPSLGPLVQGHVLLVPMQHVTSLARLEGDAFVDLTKKADQWASKVSSDQMPLIFEHGTPSDDTRHGGCGICHCHLHLLPMPKQSCERFDERLAEFLKRFGYDANFLELGSWDALRTHATSAYIAVRIGAGALRVLPIEDDVAVQSQLLRQFVSSELVHSATPWDWRDASGSSIAAEKEEITTSAQQFKRIFGS